jgi:hypothetical protein
MKPPGDPQARRRDERKTLRPGEIRSDDSFSEVATRQRARLVLQSGQADPQSCYPGEAHERAPYS